MGRAPGSSLSLLLMELQGRAPPPVSIPCPCLTLRPWDLFLATLKKRDDLDLSEVSNETQGSGKMLGRCV